MKNARIYAQEIEAPPRDEDFAPRPWQSRVLAYLERPANDRKIIWVYDSEGKAGKSRLARHLIMEHNAVQLEGRVQDMAFMYNKEPIVVIDITRAQAEHSNHLYSFAEKLKNGVLVSTKYECVQKLFKPPHVVFFSNSEPDMQLWTSDRLQLLDLSKPAVTGPLHPQGALVVDPFALGFA